KKFVEASPQGRSKLLTTTPLFSDYFGLDTDKVRLKAQLKHQMRRILDAQQAAEGKSSSRDA
ncbi:MAG: hypothetical protein V3U94_04405, partial [Candidatus Thorarchaeota archaeon]